MKKCCGCNIKNCCGFKCCAFEKIDDKKRAILNKINGICFALFLLLIGSLWLLPKGLLPESSWLIGLGAILIGGNIARCRSGIRLCNCTGILGLILLAAGVVGLFSYVLPVFPIILIVVGISIVLGLVGGCCKKK